MANSWFWMAAAIVSAGLLLTIPVQTHAVKIDLTAAR